MSNYRVREAASKNGGSVTGRMTKQYLSDVRLCVTGGSSVGKSAITVRFLTRRFIGEYQRDVEQTYRGFIDFGTDTIKYDLKDTARSPDKTFLTTWPTCIAVIYSINDIASFAIASKLLDDIHTAVQRTMDCETPSIALIGNKKDLEHLRNVREEDGRNLADKHGATFWEVSASEDYYSTFKPLHSLIVTSFVNSKSDASSVSSSPSSPSGNDENVFTTTKTSAIKDILRRSSEPCRSGNARIITSPNLETESRKKSDDAVARNLNSNSRTTIKRKRSKLRENKTKSPDRGVKMTSSPRPTTPTTNESSNDDCSYGKVTPEVPDTSNDVPPTTPTRKAHHRSQSLSKGDKKRAIHRKANTQKQQPTRNNERRLSKSHSFTDLKTFKIYGESDHGRGMVSAKSELALNVEDDDKDSQFNDKENLKESLRSISTSSFSRIENGGKHYWNKLRRDRKKCLGLSLEKVYGDNNNNNNNEEDKTTENDSNKNGKMSVRRKISSIFLRPRNIDIAQE